MGQRQQAQRRAGFEARALRVQAEVLGKRRGPDLALGVGVDDLHDSPLELGQP